MPFSSKIIKVINFFWTCSTFFNKLGSDHFETNSPFAFHCWVCFKVVVNSIFIGVEVQMSLDHPHNLPITLYVSHGQFVYQLSCSNMISDILECLMLELELEFIWIYIYIELYSSLDAFLVVVSYSFLVCHTAHLRGLRSWKRFIVVLWFVVFC